MINKSKKEKKTFCGNSCKKFVMLCMQALNK